MFINEQVQSAFTKERNGESPLCVKYCTLLASLGDISQQVEGVESSKGMHLSPHVFKGAYNTCTLGFTASVPRVIRNWMYEEWQEAVAATKAWESSRQK